MLKTTTGGTLAVAVLVLLSGCSKEQPPAEAGAPSEPPAAGPQIPVTHPAPSTMSSTNVDLTGITKAEGGQTIADLYAGKDTLAGTTVTVRGKVVKTNAGVMDRNWLHVRDGTGEEGSNDLTVTTAGELPKVGDTVVVSGQLSVGKDFGMGYQYPVLIEDGTINVEGAGS